MMSAYMMMSVYLHSPRLPQGNLFRFPFVGFNIINIVITIMILNHYVDTVETVRGGLHYGP